MRAGDIIFIRGHSWISQIIQKVDKGSFSHVAIAVSNTEIFEAQYYTKAHITKMEYDDYEIIRLPLTDDEIFVVINICKELQGYWYDYVQALSYLIKIIIPFANISILNNPNFLICSEAIDIILTRLKLKDYTGSLGNITPNKLYKKLLKIPGSKELI